MAPHAALHGRILVNVVDMALGAIDVFMAFAQGKARFGAVIAGHGLGPYLNHAGIFVAAQALAVLELAVVGVFMLMAAPAADGPGIESFEIGRIFAPMTGPAFGVGVFAGQIEIGPLVVIEDLGLPARGRVAHFAFGRPAEFFEAILVSVVLGVADLAGFVRSPSAEGLGVAFVAAQLAV